MSQTKPLWSVPIALPDIPETGRRFELAADEATRAELAKLVGLRALPHLEATFDVARHGPKAVRVTGRVAAVVGQNCVVTLDPMENKIEENVDLLFAPSREPSADEEEVIRTAAAADPNAPELLIGDTLDLGGIATEFLIIGIDPYPRKPEAAFEPPPAKEDAAAHPFAALASLKKGQGGHDG
jgi:uncharacterized metal-binding protein YceD (DUF177 family)